MSTRILGDAVVSRPNPASVLNGEPEFSTWSGYEGNVYAGVWQATPGQHKVVRGPTTIEQFYILEGEIELHEDGADAPQRFSAGDLVVIEPNFRGTWRTITTVKKVYFTVSI
jgi:uncharacterized cupin superfamily protein